MYIGCLQFKRMRFSERIGKRPIKVNIQLSSMDLELRNSLWNILDLYIFTPLQKTSAKYLNNTNYKIFFETLYFHFFKEPLDQIPEDKYHAISNLRDRFFKWNYLEVYDFFDFLISVRTLPFERDEFISNTNGVLKEEMSGYRIIENQLAPLTSEIEIEAIQAGLNNTSKYSGANIHLSEALAKLSDRKNPDYRNSIKESISAIESICQVIGNSPKAELGMALKALKSKIKIHGALEQGFLKIYGYASDGDGIRHALLDEPDLDQEDALFMLVTCSAFVNYLIAKANK